MHAYKQLLPRIYSAAKAKRHEALKKYLKGRYYPLDVIEIENLLTPDVIKNILEHYEGDSQNINDFQYADYKDQRLGEFLEKKVIRGTKRRKGSYKEDSGTIAGKVDFCDRAIDEIKSFADLSDEAKSLAEKLYKFIESNNA